MKRVLLLTLTAAVGLVLPGALSAQSGDRAKRVSVSHAAAVWSQAGPIGSDRWSDERDSDSDSDWDSDSDSDSDRRRGGIFDRTGRDGRGSVDCRDLERTSIGRTTSGTAETTGTGGTAATRPSTTGRTTGSTTREAARAATVGWAPRWRTSSSGLMIGTGGTGATAKMGVS